MSLLLPLVDANTLANGRNAVGAEGPVPFAPLRSPRWESITEDRIWSNLSKTKNIPPKAVIFSDFMLTFAMSLMILLVLICSTKVSEKSDMAKSWAARLCRFARRRTFCCSGTYKKCQTKVLRNLGFCSRFQQL